MMAKLKRKLTAREKAGKKQRKLEYMTIFINGKQKRIRRPPTIEGMPADEFVLSNADPIWLHQHGEWHAMEPEPNSSVTTHILASVVTK